MRPAHMAQVGERALVRAVGWSTVQDRHRHSEPGSEGPPPQACECPSAGHPPTPSSRHQHSPGSQ